MSAWSLRGFGIEQEEFSTVWITEKLALSPLAALTPGNGLSILRIEV